MEAILYTLICSVFAAFYFISNDIFKMHADVMVFWRGVLIATALLPLLFFIEWDMSGASCFILITVGVIATFGDIYFFNKSKIYSAAAMSRIITLRNALLFFM